jgi:glycogen(starch) synthase
MASLGAGTFALGVRSPLHYPLAIRKLARLLRTEHAMILHAHCFYPTLVGLFAARRAGTRFVFTRHHSDHNIRLGKRWHTRIDAACARRADRVIAVSEATARIMTDVERVPPAIIRIVHNGMEPLPEATPDAVAALRREIGLRVEDDVCLILGRLHEEKGHHVLFHALPLIRQHHPSVRLLVAGDGPHRAEMEAAVARFGLEGVVTFLGRRTDVPTLLALAAVVVVPSLAESFGFVALEAMAVGRPVVAAATGGLPEVVEDGRSGLLVPQGDPRPLAAAVASLLASPALASALGEEGRRRRACFTAERMVRGYEAVYGELLGG